ncbi:MAG: hypothetical protein KF809_09640 [Chloroflexi bacterium]|nr:hypothetical protein [Chloroflexota bacterium]
MLLLVLLGLCLLAPGLTMPATARAADPGPSAEPALVTMTVEPLLAGTIRPGAWTALRVHLENAGPAIQGELRVTSTTQGGSSSSVAVELPTGARQEHLVHTRAGPFGSRLRVDLVADDTVVLSTRVAASASDPEALGVFVLAERPDRLVGDIRAAVASRRPRSVAVTPIVPSDLPDRVEAWAAVDRLVWQDVSPSMLSVDQAQALVDWVALGGELVVVAGSSGLAGVAGFPDDLLPYEPTGTVEVPLVDLASLLGTLPVGATPLPALAGSLHAGTALATSGDAVIAARRAIGQGGVTLVGVDLATSWLAGSSVAAGAWSRMVTDRPAAMDTRVVRDQSILADALSVLPSVEVPHMDQLFLLFLAYVILIGPVSYIVLGRLDRREWAWVTTPVLVLVFAAIAFLMGTVLRGNNVVVNQLAIVRGALGTDRGVADVRIGVFAPSRRTFDVTLPGGALISPDVSDDGRGDGQALTVTLGEPARVRGLQVGFGDLRSFETQAMVPAPRMDAQLRLVEDHVVGTVRNASDLPLDDVVFAYGGRVATFGDLAPGATIEVDLPPGAGGLRRTNFDELLAGIGRGDAGDARATSARRAIVRALAGRWWWDDFQGSDPLAGYGPVLLGWRSEPILEVDVGEPATSIGETLHVVPVQVIATGPVSFTGQAIDQALLDLDAFDGWENGGAFVLGRGTMTVAYRPPAFEGTLTPTGLLLRLDRTAVAVTATEGELLAPLPADVQPDQANPVATGIDGLPDGPRDLPRVQLLDRTTQTWMELPPLTRGWVYAIAEPDRYLDPAGGLQVRFVQRVAGDEVSFGLGMRVEGEVR